MGYYTDFSLSFDMPESYSDVQKQQIIDEIKAMDSVEYDGYGNYYANIKWYSFDNDMLYLSHLFPEVLFILRGNGEEEEDIWQYFYKNGGVQRDGIVVQTNPFDESKLEFPKLPDEPYEYSYGHGTEHRRYPPLLSGEIEAADTEAMNDILEVG